MTGYCGVSVGLAVIEMVLDADCVLDKVYDGVTLALDEKLCDSVVDSVALSVPLFELDRVVVNVLDIVDVSVAEVVEL